MFVFEYYYKAQYLIADISESRLEVAKTLGADHTLLVSQNDAETLAQQVAEKLGSLADVTIECSGAESSIRLAIFVSNLNNSHFFFTKLNKVLLQGTRSGGVVVLVGLGQAEIKVPIVNAAVREVDIRGIFRYANW